MFVATRINVRYGQVALLWTAIIIGYVLRVNMSVGVVAMTSNKSSADPNHQHQFYNWTEVEKSRLLSSFFWGYLVLQVAFGNTAEKIGSKTILAVAMGLASLLTVVIPFVTDSGYVVVMVLRILEGLVQGSLYPCVMVHVSKWVPPIERVRALAFCFSGSTFGPLIGFPLCGFLASSSGGWPLVFYFTGGLGFVWVVLWMWFGANSPSEHGTISDAEKSYIETAIKHNVKTIEGMKTPWKAIFTSVPVYALVMASIVENWGYWTLLTEMPNYMSAVLGLNMKQNGLLSSLPYFFAYMTTLLYSWIAGYVTKHYKISKTLHRNIWNSISMWGSAIMLLILGHISMPTTFEAVLLLILTVSLMTAMYNGFMTNHIDLTPNFCGTLIGITNSTSTIGPILGPLCVGWLVDDPTSEEEWNVVFKLTSAIMFTGNLIYIIFSSSEIQPWNNPTLHNKSGNLENGLKTEKEESTKM